MKINLRKILALLMVLALTITTITFTAGNTLKAAGEDEGEAPAVAEEPAAPAPEAEAPAPAEPEVAPAPQEEQQELAVEDPADAEGEAAQEEEETQMPAQNFSGSAGGVSVSVSAPKGALPEGTKMVVKAISDSRAMQIANQAMDTEVSDAIGVDISFHKDGKEIEPKKAVSVKMSLSNSLDGSNGQIIHKSDSGSVQSIGSAGTSSASFQSKDFSERVMAVTSANNGTKLHNQASNLTESTIKVQGYTFELQGEFYVDRSSRHTMTTGDNIEVDNAQGNEIGKISLETNGKADHSGNRNYWITKFTPKAVDVTVQFPTCEWDYSADEPDWNELTTVTGTDKANIDFEAVPEDGYLDKATFTFKTVQDGQQTKDGVTYNVHYENGTVTRTGTPIEKKLTTIVGHLTNVEAKAVKNVRTNGSWGGWTGYSLGSQNVSYTSNEKPYSTSYLVFIKAKDGYEFDNVGTAKSIDNPGLKTAVYPELAAQCAAAKEEGYTHVLGWYRGFDWPGDYGIDNLAFSASAVKKTDTVIIGTDSSKEYDGNALVSTPATVSGTDAAVYANNIQYSTDNGAHWTKTLPQIVNVADSKTIKVKATASGYVTIYGQYSLTVTPATFTIDAVNYGQPYDGAAHSGGIVGGTEGLSGVKYSTDGGASWKDEAPSVTDANVEALDEEGGLTYMVKASKTNYQETSATGTLKVAPKAVTITALSKTKTFGEDDPAFGFNGDPKDAFVQKDRSSLEFSGNIASGDHESLGTHDDVYIPTVTGPEAVLANYSVTAVKGSLTVNPAGFNIEAKNYNGVYTGKAHTAGIKGSTEGLTLQYSTDGGTSWKDEAPSVTDVNESALVYSVKASKTGYRDATAEGSIKVNPAAIHVETQGSEKTYDGKALTEEKASVVGLVNEETATVKGVGSRTIVGESANDAGQISWGTAKAGNYTVNSADNKLGTLKVNPAEVTVTAENKEKIYGEDDPAFTARVEGMVNGEAESLIKYSPERENGENVGSYKINVKGEAEQGNYKVIYKQGELTITKRAITVTSASASKTYDGKALRADSIQVGGKGMAKDQKVIAYFDHNGQTEVGSMDNTFNWTIVKLENPADKAEVKALVAQEANNKLSDNYDVTVKFGKLTVTEAPAGAPVADNAGGNGGGAAANPGLVAADGANLTELGANNTPLANSLLDDNCCILHLILMLLALIALILYTMEMKRRQKRIFELETQLEGDEVK